jgi:hypothetical protein
LNAAVVSQWLQVSGVTSGRNRVDRHGAHLLGRSRVLQFVAVGPHVSRLRQGARIIAGRFDPPSGPSRLRLQGSASSFQKKKRPSVRRALRWKWEPAYPRLRKPSQRRVFSRSFASWSRNFCRHRREQNWRECQRYRIRPNLVEPQNAHRFTAASYFGSRPPPSSAQNCETAELVACRAPCLEMVTFEPAGRPQHVLCGRLHSFWAH